MCWGGGALSSLQEWNNIQLYYVIIGLITEGTFLSAFDFSLQLAELCSLALLHHVCYVSVWMPVCVHVLSLLLCKNETTSNCIFFLFHACIDCWCHYFSLYFCFLFHEAKLCGLALLYVYVSRPMCTLFTSLPEWSNIQLFFFSSLSFVIVLIADVIVFIHFCFSFQKAKLSKDDVTPTEDYSSNSKGLKKENSKVCIACFFAGVCVWGGGGLLTSDIRV